MKDKIAVKAIRELTGGASQFVEAEDYHFWSCRLKNRVGFAGTSRNRRIVWWHKKVFFEDIFLRLSLVLDRRFF